MATNTTKDVHTNRRERLRRIIDETPGGIAELSARLGYSKPAYLSALTSRNATRNIGNGLARQVEVELGLEPRTLDRPLSADGLEPVRVPLRRASKASGIGVTFGQTTEPERIATPRSTPAPAPAPKTHGSVDTFRLIAEVIEREGVKLGPAKSAEFFGLVMGDAEDHGGQPRSAFVEALARLLK